MAEYKLNGAYNLRIISKDLNDRFAEIYGRNVVLEGFLVEARASSKVAILRGRAVVSGVLISETENTPVEILLSIPPNTTVQDGKKYYVYLEYIHDSIAANYRSMADVKVSNIDPGAAKNVVRLAIVTKRFNSNDILPSDIEIIEYTNISLATITSVVGNLNGDLGFNDTSKGIELISKDGLTYLYPNSDDIDARDTIVLNSSKSYTDILAEDVAKIDKQTLIGAGVYMGNIDPLVNQKFTDVNNQLNQIGINTRLMNAELILERRTSDPVSPATGRIWIRSDL